MALPGRRPARQQQALPERESRTYWSRVEDLSGDPKWQRESLLKGTSPSEFAATQKYSAFAAPTPETILCRLLAELQASETTNSRLTSTGRGENTDWFANVRKGRKSNPALYHFDFSGRREHEASRAISANGSTFCELATLSFRKLKFTVSSSSGRTSTRGTAMECSPHRLHSEIPAW